MRRAGHVGKRAPAGGEQRETEGRLLSSMAREVSRLSLSGKLPFAPDGVRGALERESQRRQDAKAGARRKRSGGGVSAVVADCGRAKGAQDLDGIFRQLRRAAIAPDRTVFGRDVCSRRDDGPHLRDQRLMSWRVRTRKPRVFRQWAATSMSSALMARAPRSEGRLMKL